MFKNVAAKFIVFAFDATTNVPKTGDAANITAYVAKDYGTVTVLADTSATEMDATNAPGYYLFDAAQGETNGDCLLVSAKSATSNIKVIGAPAIIFTRPTTGWLAPATAGRTLVVDAAGLADANVVKVGPTGSGTAQTARDLGLALPAAAPQAAGGLITSAAGSLDLDEMNVDIEAIQAFGAPPTVAAIATGVWQDTTAGDFTVALSIGKSVMNGVALGTGLTINGYTGNTVQTGDTYALANGASGFAAIKAETAEIDAVTDQFAFTVANQVDSNVITKTGFVLSAAGSAALTEGYPTLQGTGTLAQILYAILQHLEESAISGAVQTIKKRDQATTAETFTLDSATAPTSITRAT